MKKYFVLALAFVMVLTWGSSILGLSDTLTIPIFTRSGQAVLFDVDLPELRGTLVPVAQSDTAITYNNGPYQVEVTEAPRPGGTVVRVVVTTTNNQSFWVSSFSVTARASRSPVQGVWFPSSAANSGNIMTADPSRSISGISDANYGIPYIAAAASNLGSAFALGLGRQNLPVSITGRPVGGDYEFRLKATTARSLKVFDESFYISGSTTGAGWFETAADYAAWVDVLNGYQRFPISAGAYEPVYDTWYWSADRVDDRLYMETADLASEAGFGIYLADSGWDAPTGEYDRWLSGRTGDYNPPPDKFDDLAATFAAIRTGENLGIDLWLQPFAVGRESSRYERTRSQHIQIPTQQNPLFGWSGLTSPPFALPLGQNLETVNLCPRVPAAQTYFRSLFLEMASKYRPDGYWIDFIDGLSSYCIAPHTHSSETFGEGLNRSLDIIRRTVRFTNPNAMVHFRAPYANLNTKSFANIWQTEDSPGDFDRMRLSSIRMRPFSSGVAFASDQMYWPTETDEATVSRFIVTSVMTGVPAFGPNLADAPAGTREMIKAWLGFYRRYRADLALGRFSIFGQLRVPNHKIEGQNRTFAYIRNLDFQELRADTRSTFLVNASDGNNISGKIRGPASVRIYQIQVFNRFLQMESNRIRLRPDRNGIVEINIGVQQGGLVVLNGIE